MRDQAFDQLIRNELKDIMANLIWFNDDGEYEVFGYYKIIPMNPGYDVWIHATHAGHFNSTRTALSWCIADKYKNYNLARELLNLDNWLNNLKNDIFVRAAVANKTQSFQLKDNIETKLEPKIIKKKELEIALANCVNSAKYLQQRGFANETARTSRNGTNKTSR
jgi:hypothetical protein